MYLHVDIQKTIKIFYILLGILYISLAIHLPLSLYPNAGLDDALFSNLGQEIIGGHWLGDYSNTTFAKGPSFPIFLALNSMLGTPVTLTIAALYLFACYWLVRKLNDIGLDRWWAIGIFIALLFHPYLLPFRVTRDAIYPALTLLIVSAAISIISNKGVEKGQMFFYGFIFGFFWLTREEGIWILPGFILVIAIKCYIHLKNRSELVRLFKSCTYFLFGAFLYIGTIASVNFVKYGVFQTVDFKGSAYSRVLSNLYSVDVGPEIPFLPVPAAKREVIYGVSPSFAKLRDYFEDKGMGWTIHGCGYYEHTCGDYANGWFIWALRSAVEYNGYYDKPKNAENFYRQINQEIEDACASGKLTCHSRFVSFLPPVTKEQIESMPSSFHEAIKLAIVLSPIRHTGGASNDPLERLNKLRFFLGNPKNTLSRTEEDSESSASFSGWYYSNLSTNWISLNCDDEERKFEKSIDRLPSPDVAKYFNNSSALNNRFIINLSATQARDCSIRVTGLTGSLGLKEVLEDKNSTSKNYKIEGGAIQFDKVASADPLEAFKTPLKIKAALVTIYQYSVPVIALCGLISLLCALWKQVIKQRKCSDLLIVAIMAWTLFFTRIILLSILDAVSFPTVSEYYMSAAFSLVLFASLLSISFIFKNR